MAVFFMPASESSFGYMSKEQFEEYTKYADEIGVYGYKGLHIKCFAHRAHTRSRVFYVSSCGTVLYLCYLFDENDVYVGLGKRMPLVELKDIHEEFCKFVLYEKNESNDIQH